MIGFDAYKSKLAYQAPEFQAVNTGNLGTGFSNFASNLPSRLPASYFPEEPVQEGLRNYRLSNDPSLMFPNRPKANEPVLSPTNGSDNKPVTNVPKTEYSPIISKYASQYNVPEYIIAKVAGIESGFNPKALSPTGVLGLMQTTQATTKAMGFDPNDRANPETSIGA
jgi:soluble lytic murein transglycosylase-like protein